MASSRRSCPRSRASGSRGCAGGRGVTRGGPRDLRCPTSIFWFAQWPDPVQHGRPSSSSRGSRSSRARGAACHRTDRPRGGSDDANRACASARRRRVRHERREDLDFRPDQADATVVFRPNRLSRFRAHGVTRVARPMNHPGITTNRFDCHGSAPSAAARSFWSRGQRVAPLAGRIYRLGEENKGFVK